MPQYLYQLAYTPEALAAQIENPQDRLKTAAIPVLNSVGGKLLGGGFSFGEFDVCLLIEAPDDESAAAVAIAVGAGGAVRSARTTKLMSGDQWITASTRAGEVKRAYNPKP